MKRNHRDLRAWQQAAELVRAVYRFTSGSLSELDTLAEVAVKLSYVLDAKKIQRQIDDVSGLVMGLSASLKRRT